VAHRGFDFESAHVAAQYARRAAALIGATTTLSAADALVELLPPLARSPLRKSKSVLFLIFSFFSCSHVYRAHTTTTCNNVTIDAGSRALDRHK
jgi:hypothetical protein